MKRIQFDKVGGNWKFAMLMILSLIFLIAGYFMLDGSEYPIVKNVCVVLAHGIQVALISRMFWFKNYVRWNKKGLYIKTNSYCGHTINFDQIVSLGVEENRLSIEKSNGKNFVVNLKNIIEDDRKKLLQIFKDHNCILSVS